MEPISRKQVIERLRAVDLGGGSHESLSAIAKAVYEPAGGWTIVACEALRQTLVRLLGGDAAQGGCVTNELPDLLRKASEGSYEGSKGDVIGNIAQLIGCKSRITFAVIDALADKVEQALSEAYTKGHLNGFDEAERWHTERSYLLGENTHITPSDSERITDELRGFAEDPLLSYASQETHKEIIIAIADRIDAAHEREISRAAQLLADAEKDRDLNYANWQDCKQKVLRHNITIDELSAEIERLKDELAHRIELPKDADGEPIHMGDLVTVPWEDKVYEVAGFSCSKQLCSGIRTIWIDVYSPEKQRNVSLCRAGSCRHYHAPTVEDVLCELLDKVDDDRAGQAEVIAEYAAKLRLAYDGKEQ